MNPFFESYKYIPFDKIKEDDYEPAIMEGIRQENEDIERIIHNEDYPTFENTIVALDFAGSLLDKVTSVFYNLLEAETNDKMDELAQKFSPILSEHSNNIILNKPLFDRVKTVYEDHKADNFNRLDAEAKMLLCEKYRMFELNGANLPEEKKESFRKLSADISMQSLLFSQNKLKDTNDFVMNLTKEDEVEGLPESLLDMAKQDAKEKSMNGYAFTLQGPSYTQFMTYSKRRDLRKKMYMAYNTIGIRNNSHNNIEAVRQVVDLKRRKAQMLGFETYADYALTRRMAEKPENVYKLLNDLLNAYMPKAQEETKEVEHLYYEDMNLTESELQESDERRFMPWDHSFYSNMLKEKKYSLNSEMLRPYFELENVKKGVFGLATRLYGITFKQNKQAPLYHPDVVAYDVIDKDGSFLALLYADFHPRATKRSGAWMTEFKGEWRDKDGKRSAPVVSIVMNLSKPTDTRPALLTLGEVETFLHEFGHSLHGMFANTTYPSISGTNVYWDFVELPSQFMENYSTEQKFLCTFAKHYQTGEDMPEELIKRILACRNFNAAYACVRQVSFGLLDMAYFTQKNEFTADVPAFEREAWKKAQVLPTVEGTCMTTQFSHIISGGYSAGYYSYKWAEVLDADAFAKFKENGIFDESTANSFRTNILSKGGTEHPMTLYKRFRGQEPTIKALLKRNGIITLLCIVMTAITCLFASCSNEDDIDEIFIGKTWYMNGATVNGLRLNSDVKIFYTEDGSGAYYITFSNGTFNGMMSAGDSFSGTWKANGKKQSITLDVKNSPDMSTTFDRQIFNIISNSTSYSSGADFIKMKQDKHNEVLFGSSRNKIIN